MKLFLLDRTYVPGGKSIVIERDLVDQSDVSACDSQRVQVAVSRVNSKRFGHLREGQRGIGEEFVNGTHLDLVTRCPEHKTAEKRERREEHYL